MKTMPPEFDQDYDGNKGCLIMIIASIASFGAVIAIGLLIMLIINIIKIF
jgi:hypothetical protein